MKSKGARNQPAPPAQPQTPVSPTAKGAKYRNRDGSKFITLPDTTSAPDSAQPSPTPSAASGAKPEAATTAHATSNGPAPAAAPVNRKKQKRREKAAAKAAAEAALNVPSDNGATNSASSAGHDPNQDPDPEESEDEDDQFDSQLHHAHAQANGHAAAAAGKSKKSKKKKKKGSVAAADLPIPEISSMPQPSMTHGSGISRERIWDTGSHEERERIKEFWLGLGEDERKSLVKVEKEAVLKKMKEQQKHTCSCSVCGRKRHAIEEELEGLYDAYYEELKHFANHPQQDGHPPMMGASRHFGFHHGNRFPSYAGHQPSRGRIVEHVGDDEEEELDDEAYSEDELDDEYSDDEPEEEVQRDYVSEFFNFGNSLTVQDGILTVADDLLKNDGKKFIEMMEQLAERRMAREGDFTQDQYSRGYGHGVNGSLPTHDHPPPPPADEEEYEDEEDEDYDSQEDDEYEEEDDDTMTEEQRMEEGRRMFQIFAARMFEQRVLQAYREKVARERQAKLMEEEEEELRKEEARKEKKAKEAQKKKEKAAQKKQALAEEKARKEAEKAAEEEARRQEEAHKAEEAKRKAEEKRKKKEAQRKAEEEERAKKEAERQRQKQMQVDQERKAKEAKEREKKAREEARLKEKESRERKEREAKELKEKQDAERRQKDLESKLPKAETKPNLKQEQEERAAKKAAALAATAAPVTMTLPKRPSQHATNPALPALPQHPSSPAVASPKQAVATPALPKAPTPLRPRQPSQQGAAPGAAIAPGSASQNPSPNATTPARISPGPPGPPSNRGSIASQQSTNLSQAMSPPQANTARFSSTTQTAPLNIPPGMPFPPGLHPAPPGFGNPLFAPGAPGFRPPPPGMLPPGLTSPMLGRGFPAPAPPPGFGQPEQVPPFNPASKDATTSTHSRQPSGGYDSPSMHAAQPISRPTPIGRPSSVVQGQRPPSGSPSRTLQKDTDDAQNHLGSSALLDDSEDVLPTLPDFQSGLRRGYVAPGRIGPAFPPPAPFADPAIASMWGSPVQPSVLSPFAQAPVAPPGFGGPGGWPASPSLGFSVPSGLVRPAPVRPPASMAIRQILCSVCRDLALKEPAKDGLIPLSTVQEAMKTYVDFNPMGDGPLTENDIVALCETEGNPANGGGNFDVHDGEGVTKSIRWNPDKAPQSLGAFGAPGHIGSPVLGSSFGR
ncbi:Stress response protein NST1 [Cytospora mali]|uniref:Stress response protein NST1 n=1 Tax=Cytospora mali TaxID=578113 RepID=A0A194VWS4_CYTMA|nr:Stress response protein NST1 [Valsa mali]